MPIKASLIIRGREMSICWYCHWGWPKPVAEIYLAALERLEKLACDERPLHFGPSHAVWEDENFVSAQWYLEHFNDNPSDDYTSEELAVVRWSLEELVKLPDDILDIVPSDYDNEHPELFPPRIEVMKVNI